MSQYFRDNNKFYVAPHGAQDILDKLPPAQYIVRLNMLTGFFLERTGDFSVPDKIFGDAHQKVERVLKTYFTRNCNTGILLSGEKGSGKTMFARLLSVEAAKQGIPTVIVDDNFGNDANLNKFLSNIEERCIVLFDEFEKTFDKDEGQNKMLSLLDGTFQSNKLFILTVNNLFKINDFILNRPGRVYYHIRYNGIEEEFIREFCDYHLQNKEYTESFVSLSKVIGKFNFDILQALVQECNIHNEPPSKNYQFMNIDIDDTRDPFSYTLIHSGGAKKNGTINTSIYDSFWMYININSKKTQNDDDNDDDDEKSIYFGYSNIVEFDKSRGLFIYKKDEYTLEMRREKKHNFELVF